MQRLALRLATPDDAAAVTCVFHAAIHGKAARSYDAEQLAAWCAGRDEAQFRRDLERGMNPFLVAEAVTGGGPAPPPARVVGFGALRGDEVAYLYAAPQAPPGTGGALLRELERRAVEQGWPELRLTASLNALVFYKEHGYRELRRDIRAMSVDGGFVRLVAIEMRKRLENKDLPVRRADKDAQERLAADAAPQPSPTQPTARPTDRPPDRPTDRPDQKADAAPAE